MTPVRQPTPGLVQIVAQTREVAEDLQCHTLELEWDGREPQTLTILSPIGTHDDDIAELLGAVTRFPCELYLGLVLRAVRHFLDDGLPVPRYLWGATVAGPVVRH